MQQSMPTGAIPSIDASTVFSRSVLAREIITVDGGRFEFIGGRVSGYIWNIERILSCCLVFVLVRAVRAWLCSESVERF